MNPYLNYWYLFNFFSKTIRSEKLKIVWKHLNKVKIQGVFFFQIMIPGVRKVPHGERVEFNTGLLRENSF